MYGSIHPEGEGKLNEKYWLSVICGGGHSAGSGSGCGARRRQGEDVIYELVAGPVLRAYDFAGDAAIGANDVGFGPEFCAVGGGDVLGGIAESGEDYFVLAQKFFVGGGIFINADAENRGAARLNAGLQRIERCDFVDARRAPGSPEIQDDNFAAEIGEVLGAAVELHREVECAGACDGWLTLSIGGRREDYDDCGGHNQDGSGGDAAGEDGHDTNIIAKDERGSGCE
jgi:hypothetical protein